MAIVTASNNLLFNQNMDTLVPFQCGSLVGCSFKKRFVLYFFPAPERPSRVIFWWPSASCKTHGDGPATSLTASHQTSSQLLLFIHPSIHFWTVPGFFSQPILLLKTVSLYFCHSLVLYYRLFLLFLPPLVCNTHFSLLLPSVYISVLLCIHSSLLSLSVDPGHKRVCQTFPVQVADLGHTLWGDFRKGCN